MMGTRQQLAKPVIPLLFLAGHQNHLFPAILQNRMDTVRKPLHLESRTVCAMGVVTKKSQR